MYFKSDVYINTSTMDNNGDFMEGGFNTINSIWWDLIEI